MPGRRFVHLSASSRIRVSEGLWGSHVHRIAEYSCWDRLLGMREGVRTGTRRVVDIRETRWQTELAQTQIGPGVSVSVMAFS